MVIGLGYEDRFLTAKEITGLVAESMAAANLAGKKVLVVIPDHTRTAPIGQMFRILYDLLNGNAANLDFLIALGTHPPMSTEQIYERVEITGEEHKTKYRKARFFNHLWKDDGSLVEVGVIPEEKINEITDGLFRMPVKITINRMIMDYDHIMTVGPVFPHEVVGFSGGNKYLFPGISGKEIIDFFHWLGAVISNPAIIGRKRTPVRKVIDLAASLVKIKSTAFCMVVKEKGLAGLYCGCPEEAWSGAADLSAQLHIVYKQKPFHTILSCAPKMYDDIWTAGKCMYKLEPVAAEGGTLIIYAPHITEISYAHGKVLDEVGYHTRDYFMKQWERFRGYPWGVLAHSTHVKGVGSFEEGHEKPRIEVVLATRIPEERCRRVNLGYMNPESIHPEEYKDREGEGVLYVPRAGEMLYQLK